MSVRTFPERPEWEKNTHSMGSTIPWTRALDCIQKRKELSTTYSRLLRFLRMWRGQPHQAPTACLCHHKELLPLKPPATTNTASLFPSVRDLTAAMRKIKGGAWKKGTAPEAVTWVPPRAHCAGEHWIPKSISGLDMHSCAHTVCYCFSAKIYNQYIYIMYFITYIQSYLENGLATRKLQYVIRGERHTNVIHREAESKTVTTRIQKSTKK